MSDDYIKLWVDAVNTRGISGTYARNGFENGKEVSESLQFSTWRDAVEFSRNGNFGLIRRNDDDPPDFVVDLNGKQIGVEVTELVNEEFLRYNEENPQKPLNAYVVGDGFEMTQWNLQIFKERLLKCVSKKGEKYTKNGIHIEVLAIVCDEPWLFAKDVCDWLPQVIIPKLDCFGQIDLVLKYEGGQPGHHPIFKVD